MFACGFGSFNSRAPPPSTFKTVHESVFIEFSGVIHGPPASDHPSQLCMPMSTPYSEPFWTAYLKVSNHSGELKTRGPGAVLLRILLLQLAPMLNIMAAPYPFSDMAFKSASMPSLETLPSIQCHHVCGRDFPEGFRKSSYFGALDGASGL